MPVTRSTDGTRIAYRTVGAGPPVIVVPGALSTAADLAAFARWLAPRYEVHVMERRGRGESGPQGTRYGMITEREDVLALRQATGAERILGHSYGGLIALEVASSSDGFSRIAVYEPGVSIAGSTPTSWMASYARHLSEGKRNEALVDFVLGSQATGPRPPRWLMKMLLPMAIPRAARRQMLHLLDENLREHQEIARLEDSYPKYRAIEGDVLLMCGGARGSATACRTIETLATVIPHATTRRFARLDHFALQKRGMAEVAAAVADFFA